MREFEFAGRKVVEIRADAENYAHICPEKGGLIYRLVLGGKEIFYLDQETFEDDTKDIRGGCPFLFPICGRLKNGETTLNGQSFAMNTHGFGRNCIFSYSSNNDHSVVLRTVSNLELLRQFPYQFSVTFTISIEPGKLTLSQQYENQSETEMPLQFGFHPYFLLNGDHAIRYYGMADKVLDYMDENREVMLPTAFIPNQTDEYNLIFCDASFPFKFRQGSENPFISLDAGEPYKYLVIWALKDKPYLCIEPWTALPDAMNTGNDLITVKPGDHINTYISFGLN